MVITKILNNNVVLSTNDRHEEVVIMGRGLAFSKKIGDEIDQSLIDKTFTLGNSESEHHFVQLLSEVDIKYFNYVEELIAYAKEKLGKKLNNSIYVTLLDHLNTLEERARINAYIKNPMLWDIKRLYRDEFEVALKIVDKINDKLNSKFDENEAANIAMHFVNAELETNLETVMSITKVISEILNIVKYHFKVVYNEESLGYYRFVTHLRFFSQRIFSGNSYTGSDDLELFEMIKEKYEEFYECILIIKDFLFKEYEYVLEDEECLYLTIHVAKVVRESEEV